MIATNHVTEYQSNPTETLEVIKPILKEIGVTRLADLTGMDCVGVPCYASIRPDSQSLSVDSGKGLTKEQAKCSAAMESIERWALDEIPIESYYSPPGETLINFPLNKGAIFSSRYPHRWAVAYDLEGKKRLVPYYAVKLYEESTPFIEKCWYASTTGMASGVTREAAIEHGLYEVIERDAVHLAMLQAFMGKGQNRLDLDTVIDSEANEVIEQIRAAGADVFVYNCPSESGVPVFMSVIADEAKGMSICKGYGAHHDPLIALKRALCESCQSRCVIWAGARDDITHAKHQTLIRDATARRWTEALREEKAVVDFGNFEPVEKPDLNYLVVDFPLPWEQVSSVKVLLPGYAAYWSHYAAEGRP
jgi:ribosomal protein S12 methylthiotransferase accessory factor